VARRIAPSLTIQAVEMAEKPVKAGIDLQQAGVAFGREQFGVLPPSHGGGGYVRIIGLGEMNRCRCRAAETPERCSEILADSF